MLREAMRAAYVELVNSTMAEAFEAARPSGPQEAGMLAYVMALAGNSAIEGIDEALADDFMVRLQ